MPLATFSSGSQTFTINNSGRNYDGEPESPGPVTEEERESLLNTVLDSAGHPTRRNYEAMMKNNGAEPTRNTRGRINNAGARNSQVIVDNMSQRAIYFEAFNN
ncbi:hypothetical protein INT47_000404 [Mucor saturninus]|uniref:Uncharacterized protein n=1 Tax=Mucor saturninus TaxID=64648 RepID=A0A8H7UZW2_9FUNG|nr:hypothetical protein INT47_000404 [Mucor saturninus]